MDGLLLGAAAAAIGRRAKPDDAIDAHRRTDILEALLAQLLEGGLELVADLVIGRAGDVDAAGIRGGFQARGDVDAVAIEIAALHHDVAEIDADAQHDAAVLRLPGGRRGHRLLDVDGALHGVHRAAELHHDAVAGHLEDAALVLGHQRRDDLLAARLERAQGPHLVQLHQPAVADDIGGEDGGKAALEAIFDHAMPHEGTFGANHRNARPQVSIETAPTRGYSDRNHRCGGTR